MAIRQSRAWTNSTKRASSDASSSSGPIGSPETIATPPTTRYARNARSLSLKKYDLSARSANGASVSSPYVETRACASSRSRASWRRRYRHGASHAASTTTTATSPRMTTEAGNHTAKSPLRCRRPWTSESPTSARLVSDSENESVNGRSATSRFTQRAAAP